MDPEELTKVIDKRLVAFETSMKFDIERQRNLIFKNKKLLEAGILTNKRNLVRAQKRQNLGWILHVTAIGLVAWLVISVTSMRAEIAGVKDQVSFLENAASFLMGKNQEAKKNKVRDSSK